MLNIKFLYSFLFLFMATVLFSSCRKDDINDLENERRSDIITIITAEFDLKPNITCYFLIENSESPAVYFKVSHFLSLILQRKGTIKGNTFNFHTIFVDELNGNNIEMQSFFDIPIGREIIINNDYLKYEKTVGSTSQLIIKNIPNFDIISRTAKYPEKGYTQTTFETPATTVENGGETFEKGGYFYSCFQTNDLASYYYQRIPLNSVEFTIDFNSLNLGMDKHTFQKNKADAIITHADVVAYNNPFYFSGIQVFSLDDFNIFPNSTFNIFLPSEKRIFGYYTQNYIFENSDYSFNNWYFSREINNSFELLDVGLSTTSQIGQLPKIETTLDSFDEIEIIFKNENFYWIMHSPNSTSFYIPEIPIGISNKFPESNTLHQMLLQQVGGTVKIIDYSSLDGYEGSLDLNLGETRLEIESNYHTQEQSFKILSK